MYASSVLGFLQEHHLKEQASKNLNKLAQEWLFQIATDEEQIEKMSSCVCGGLRVRRTCDLDLELFKKDYGIVKKKKKEVFNGILGVAYL